MKTAAALIILAILALGAGWLVFSKPAYPLTQDDARKFFLEDLAQKYPNADVREIMEINSMASPEGSAYYQLKARVTTGLSTPCPERLHVYYDYPPKNFVAQPPEYITKNCQVCINEPACILAFPEEAIIASHTYNGSDYISAYIGKNADASAQVSFADSYGDYTGVWLVKWSSPAVNYTYTAILSKTQNRLLAIEQN